MIDRADGKPPAALVRAADGRVLGYAFSSLDVSGSVGYAGRPLDIVAAVTPDGIVAGHHSQAGIASASVADSWLPAATAIGATPASVFFVRLAEMP